VDKYVFMVDECVKDHEKRFLFPVKKMILPQGMYNPRKGRSIMVLLNPFPLSGKK